LIIANGDQAGRVVYRDDSVVAFFPKEPATVGHTLVVPRRHVTDIWGLESAEAEHLASASLRVARALRAALNPDGLNVIQSNGDAATQTVPHVHVHVVPRWDNDQMELSWPPQAAETEAEMDQTLRKVQEHLPPTSAPTPEDRRHHLTFIQSVITRMSLASASAKTWLLPIVTAAYGYALTKNTWSVAALGIGAVLVFGLLDANYLKQERAFRQLYDRVASGGRIPHFSMNPTLAASESKRINYWPEWPDIKSWAVAPVYGPLLIVGLGIVAWQLFH
jgi:histidine triad (HIT) family protein